MSPAIDIVRSLTNPTSSLIEKRQHAVSFSRQFGWRPNDIFDVPSALPTVNLIVEQGLEHAAMLSFLPSNHRLSEIRGDQRRHILGLSYNSLIDWHVWIDTEHVEVFYNRVTEPVPTYAQSFDNSDYSALTKQVFDEAVGKVPKPDFLTLDGALFDTITTWREILHRELKVETREIAALFNAIILARAVEDFHNRIGTVSNAATLRDRITGRGISIGHAIEQLVLDLTGTQVSNSLFDCSTLSSFDSLPVESRISLVDAFYRHRAVPYDYDFAVMSKYALSKIYERYVAVMREDVSFQLSMLPSTKDEPWNKELGGIYTPQYIASFFAKYLCQRVPPEQFINLFVADPACGSGIFLRAVMEQKVLSSNMPSNVVVDRAFDLLFGMDIDDNAVAASRLSLALLYLAATGKLPTHVPVNNGDSLQYFATSPGSLNRYDAVLVNPPFVRTELQSDVVREAVRQHANFGARGKLDTYVAFLVFAIRALRPGGFGCFVVPQSLLTSDNLRPVRDWVLEQTWVRVVADLSAIRVFKAGVYVTLLIVEKKSDRQLMAPSVSVIRCQREVGLALDDLLDGNYVRTPSRAIFSTNQEALERPTWSVPFPEESHLLRKLEALPRLSDFAVVQPGVITGADDVFILDAHEVPPGEDAIYARYMPDTSIGPYALPADTGKRLLYPYINGVLVSPEQMQQEFPVTWQRLERSRDILSLRKSALKTPRNGGGQPGHECRVTCMRLRLYCPNFLCCHDLESISRDNGLSAIHRSLGPVMKEIWQSCVCWQLY